MSTETPVITPDELVLMGWQTFGWGWQTRLAKEVGVTARTIRRAAAHGVLSPTLADEIRRVCALSIAAASEDEYAGAVVAAIEGMLSHRGKATTVSLLLRLAVALSPEG